MRTYFDCIPCFVRQALDAVRFVSDDKALQEKTLREVLQRLSSMDLRESPPAMGRDIHRIIRRITGSEDPYYEVKQRFNRFAVEKYPDLKTVVKRSSDPFETALRLAIAGNIIDFGVGDKIDARKVEKAIEHSLTASLEGDSVAFRGAVEAAESILYIADNAGEIGFDRLLIEELPRNKVTLSVKKRPVINDATIEDAQIVGLTDIVEVIDNGTDIPGTILEECSDAFRKRFNEVDLVIAKGQGNYETLSEVDKGIYFLLKAKCPVIARQLGCEIGSIILSRATSAAFVE